MFIIKNGESLVWKSLYVSTKSSDFMVNFAVAHYLEYKLILDACDIIHCVLTC